MKGKSFVAINKREEAQKKRRSLGRFQPQLRQKERNCTWCLKNAAEWVREVIKKTTKAKSSKSEKPHGNATRREEKGSHV